MSSVILKLKAETGFLAAGGECVSQFRPAVLPLTAKVQSWIDEGKVEVLMNPSPDDLTDSGFAQKLLANGGNVEKTLAGTQPAPKPAAQAKKAAKE